jgi:hypothetical protein
VVPWHGKTTYLSAQVKFFRQELAVALAICVEMTMAAAISYEPVQVQRPWILLCAVAMVLLAEHEAERAELLTPPLRAVVEVPVDTTA